MHFSGFAKPVAVSLLLMFGFALPAHAQNNKQIVSGTFYEDRASATSSANASLLLTFTQSPTDMFLNVTNVSCSIQVSSGQVLSTMNLQVGTTLGQIDIGRPYALKGNTNPETIGPSKVYSVVTNQVFYKMGPGRYPSIEFNSNSAGAFSYDVNCVIVGNLTSS